MIKVLFVCTGNTCRSPMAEGIFNALAKKRSLDARAVSCGISAFPGMAASADAIIAANAYGADLSGHISHAVTGEIVDAADLVCCMTGGHAETLRRSFPQHASKIRMLASADISDPFMRGADVYARSAAEIERAVVRLLDELGSSSHR